MFNNNFFGLRIIKNSNFLNISKLESLGMNNLKVKLELK